MFLLEGNIHFSTSSEVQIAVTGECNKKPGLWERAPRWPLAHLFLSGPWCDSFMGAESSTLILSNSYSRNYGLSFPRWLKLPNPVIPVLLVLYILEFCHQLAPWGAQDRKKVKAASSQ